jgi:hypothetical protein
MTTALVFLMLNQQWQRRARQLFFTLVLSGLLLSIAEAKAIDLVVHDSVPVEHLSVFELRAIYTMRLTHWSNGLAVQAFILPRQHQIHERFCKIRLQVLPRQMDIFWNRLVYSGMGKAPILVQSEQEMLDRMRVTPGAIGYVESRNEVHGENIRSIEVRP